MKNLLLATALVGFSAGFAAAQDVVRLGTEGAYPPYNFINDAGEVDGFERKFGDELCKRAELSCEWTTNEWDSIIPNLQSGNYDVIIAGMSITDQREEIVDFSQPYIPPASSAYLALSMDTDLMSGPVAAQTSTIQAAFVAENGMAVVEYATPEETVAAVKNGEAVAVLEFDGELAVGELQEILGLPQSRISTHLALLRKGGLVLDRRDGKKSFYAVARDLPASVGGIVEAALAASAVPMDPAAPPLLSTITCCASAGAR